MIDQTRKSRYQVYKFRYTAKFKSLVDLKEELKKSFPDNFLNSSDELGYIEPGHDAKGRQHWLKSEEDLDDMYKEHKTKKEIMLWAYDAKKDPAPVSHGHKRSQSPAGSSQSSKKQDCTGQADHSNGNTFLQVDKIVEDLKKEHGATYSVEQLRTWGHLIQMGKHESKTVPPDKPFFKSRTATGKKSQPRASNSPSKLINMRGQCIDKLKKAHDLLEIGAISTTQYDDLQKKICGDLFDKK